MLYIHEYKNKSITKKKYITERDVEDEEEEWRYEDKTGSE